jgi:hypothetical protein
MMPYFVCEKVSILTSASCPALTKPISFILQETSVSSESSFETTTQEVLWWSHHTLSPEVASLSLVAPATTHPEKIVKPKQTGFPVFV